jgi:hypothetical protein
LNLVERGRRWQTRGITKLSTERNDFMGLNTTHGCWNGDYLEFTLWRASHRGMKKEAAVVNVLPDGKGAAAR